MQLVYDNGGAAYELDLRIHNPDATVADLVHALDPTGDGDRSLVIDDRVAGPDLGLDECGLYEGAVVRLGAPGAGNGQSYARAAGAPPPPPPRPAYTTAPPATQEQQLELVVIGGLFAGERHPLPIGTTYVGRRDPHVFDMADPTVSTHHASFTRHADDTVQVADLGSHNGTWLATGTVMAPTTLEPDTVVRLGGAQVVVRPAKADDRPLAVDPIRHGNVSGTMPFNRPPRPAPPPPIEQLHVPEPPSKKENRSPIQIASIIAPLVFGGVMITVTGNPTFALFCLLSPVMMIASTFESRRRGKKGARKDRERFRTELAAFERRAAHAKALERWYRREAMPDPAEILRRATLPSVRVWERRPTHPDFLLLRGGVGTVRWDPPFDKVRAGRGEEWPKELDDVIAASTQLVEAPVPVELGNGGVVGLVGDRPAALAVARSLLCQATTHSGPADLPVLLLTLPDAVSDWDWSKWLPHTRDASGTRLLSADSELSTKMVESFLRAGAERQDRHDTSATAVGPTLLVVVDDESLTEGRRAPTRSLLRGLGGPVAGIVIASTADRLPAVCTTVIELRGPHGDAVLDRPQLGERISLFHATGIDEPTARRCARALARFEDPELDIVGAGLPDRLRLLPLLELHDLGPEAIEARWRARGPHPAPSAPIGVSEDGVFEVDLNTDGPHGLVAGTTGAGKSELLRTLVAGLAASTDPDHLTFVLIDFKGGSAFDECSRLPHTVGMVTDLDEHLAERALRCLEAELKYRERVFRDAKANDLPDYLRKGAVLGPLPRLLVVIDEFATLKAELPDFIDALVGVAQRGRSLGVHMLLATQRPSGAVSENIRANTNLRIALRVQDKGDSTDVLEVPDAARIPRSAAGRAYVRLGPGEIVAIQTALSTGKGGAEAAAPVELAPFPFGSAPAPSAPAANGDGEGDVHITDLTLLVDAISTAFDRSGAAAPRRPWPDDLPRELDLDAVRADRERMRMFDGRAGVAAASPIGLADDPDAQTQYPIGWKPDDNLLIYGAGGSGTSATLTTIALALATDHSPNDLHVYALDFGAGELQPLTGLPHVGAVIAATERERQVRVIGMLRAELDRRRDLDAAARAAEPTIVVMVDGLAAFYTDFDDLSGQSSWSDFQRLWNDGPEVNIVIVATGDRVGGFPASMTSVVRDKLVLRLADKGDLASFGVRSRTVPAQPPGRAIVPETGQIVQIARPADGLVAAVTRIAAAAPSAERPPPKIRTLPTEVGMGELGPVRLDSRPWFIPLGIGTRNLAPAGLTVYDGEHAVISGPARSGKSTALLTITNVFVGAAPDAIAYLVAGPRSPLRGDSRFERTLSPAEITELPALVDAASGRVLIAIDDAETFEDDGGALAGLLATHRAGFFLVAAGRNELLRSLYSHWTRAVRRSKLGVLLRPDVDLDGELLGAQIPRRSAVAMSAGRGYVCNGGESELIQLALPNLSSGSDSAA